MATKKMLLVALTTLASVFIGMVFAQNQTTPTPPATSTMTWEQMLQMLSFTVIFVGVLARALLPYLRKWLADEEIGFQKRYIAIVIASFVTAWLSFPNFSEAFVDWWQILTASFVFGFGLQSTFTEVYAWFASAATSQQQPSPTPT